MPLLALIPLALCVFFVAGALVLANRQNALDLLEPILKEQNLTLKSLTKCGFDRGPFPWSPFDRRTRVYYLTAATPDGSTRNAYVCAHRTLDIHWTTN